MHPAADADLIGDTRRASALMAHHLENSAAGVIAVIEEAAEQRRVPELIVALADLAVFVSPALRQPEAANMLRIGVAHLSTLEKP